MINKSERADITLRIRQEGPADHQAVFKLIEAAFKTEGYSDGDEKFLVERLWASEAFIPELSLVAVLYQKIVGHILLSRITINSSLQNFKSLALAPVSVLPEYQGRGIGGQLIEAAHQKARSLGHTSVILLGHAHYYPRFGYRPAHTFGITLPFDAPRENCMAVELVENALNDVHGMVQYSQAFYD